MKKGTIVLLICCMLISSLPACEMGIGSVPDGMVRIQVDWSDYQYEHYEKVIADLEEYGFSNIRTQVLYDLVTGWLIPNGAVESVSINGNIAFEKGDLYAKDAPIIVTYHTWMNNKP